MGIEHTSPDLLKKINPLVERTMAEYPVIYRKKILRLRSLIFRSAFCLSGISDLEETLKWGEPSYLPKIKNVGTTVRIHWLKSKPEQYGIYFNCQTTLVDQFKKKYPGLFNFEGKRAIIFKKEDTVPKKEMEACVSMALTYHLKKKR